MNQADVECLKRIHGRYHFICNAAAAAHGHRVEVMAGIMMRETRGGESTLLDKPGPEGRGDRTSDGRYHGHGLFQIDDRSFPQFCASNDWRDPLRNALKAGSILKGKYNVLLSWETRPPVTLDELERATIASYNCGERNVIKCWINGEDVDSRTAGHNYSISVLEYAAAYAQIVKDLAAASAPQTPPETPETPEPAIPQRKFFSWFFNLFPKR